MWKRIQELSFPFLIALSALAVSGSAAFYSVFGLSKLFAGASTQVIIMVGSLEFAKLVTASLLYQYWGVINRWLKYYLAIAVFVLMVITSGGIYGYLSGAYQETATKSEFLDKSLIVLETKQDRFEEQKTDLTLEKTQLNKSIADLRVSLSSPTSVSYWDENSQSVITTTSSSTRRALQAELKTTIEDRDNLNLKLEAVMDSVMRIDTELLDLEINNEEQRELGPLKYLSETTGRDMGTVVNWFLLLIIFVFDPLAIALVVAANMAFAQIKPKPQETAIIEPTPPEETEEWYEYDIVKGYREERNTIEPSEDLKNRVKENQNKLKEEEINELEDIDDDYFTDLEDYIKHTREEDIENLTYPQFVDKHYIPPTPEKEEKNIITSTNELTEEEINDISREIAKREEFKKEEKLNPTPEDLEKLAKALNIEYTDEDVEEDRLTDTTQTLIHKPINKEEDNSKNSGTNLKYSGRK